MKVAFPDRLHGHEHGTLYDPIPKGRNTQWPLLAVGLRDIDSSRRLWLIATCQQLGTYGVQLVLEIARHRLLVYPIDARCLCATRRQRHSGGLLQPRPVGNYPQKTIEPAFFIRRGPCGQLALHFADYQRSSPLYRQLICRASHSNCSPSPCGRFSLPLTTTGTPPAYRSLGPHSLHISINLPQSTCRTQTYW